MTSVGTFGYMAPEQLLSRPVPASDMFGLGMTMVSLGERRDVSELPVDDATGQVDPAAVLRGLQPRLRRVVFDMTKPGLAERLGDAEGALRRLDAPAETTGHASPTNPGRVAGFSSIPAHVQERLERRRAAIHTGPDFRRRTFAIFVLVLVGLAGGSYVLFKRKAERRVVIEPPPTAGQAREAEVRSTETDG